MAYKKNNRGSYVLGSEGNEFTVTKSEYKEMQTLVKRANQRRIDVSSRYYDKMYTSNSMIGVEYDEYMKLLNKTGFITEKYTTKLDQFKSKDDVKALLKELKTVTQKGYGKSRIDDVRYKMIDQINENYGSDGKELAEKISELSDGELLSVYLIADKEIISELYGSVTTDDVTTLVEENISYINHLLKGNTSKKLDKKVYAKGFKNYKQRQRNKKKKRGK